MSSNSSSLVDATAEGEKEFLRDLASACLSNSRWDLIGGRRGNYFWDIDFAPDSNELGIRLANQIRSLQARHPFDQIAFIERDSGQSGSVAYRSQVEQLTYTRNMVVWPL